MKQSSAGGSATLPDVFRLPISNVAPGEQVSVRITYLEPMRFRDGQYHFVSELAFPPGTIAPGPLQQMV